MLRKKINTPVTPYQRRRWLLGSAIIIGGFIGVAALFGWVMYTGSSKEIVAVANQFKPDASWKLESESIVPPRTLCIDVECPSVGRVWKTPGLTTAEQLKKQLEISGWEFEIIGNCLPNDPKLYSTNIRVCSAKGNQNGYTIELIVYTSNPIDTFRVNLVITKGES